MKRVEATPPDFTTHFSDINPDISIMKATEIFLWVTNPGNTMISEIITYLLVIRQVMKVTQLTLTYFLVMAVVTKIPGDSEMSLWEIPRV
jgi:hypothetical protein